MRVFFLRKCGERLAPHLERTDCQLPWCTGVEMPMGRGHRCPDMTPKGPRATGKSHQLFIVLFMLMPLPQPASPRARQLLRQGHTWR